MKWEDVKKNILKDIKCNSDNEWEILLPYDTKQADMQTLIERCRSEGLCCWHLKVADSGDKQEIKMYWLKKDLTLTE